MPLITPLFLALADLLISKLSMKTVAEYWRLPTEEFVRGFQQIEPHLWHGKLAAALASPQHRPDLIPILTDLARLESLYGDLMFQFRRAEQTCDLAHRGSDQYRLELLMKADGVSFRIHQAAARVLRDLQKARIAYEKAEKNETPETSAPVAPPTLAQASTLQTTPSSQRTADSAEQSARQEPASEEVRSPVQKNDLETPAELRPSPDSDVEKILLKHRHRLKDTPPKDRPALIERIISAERARQQQNQSRPAA